MKIISQKYIIIVITLLLFSCSAETDGKITKHGVVEKGNSLKNINIDLKKYSTYKELIDRIEEIVCSDSIPTITFNDNGEQIEIGLSNSCWEGVACRLIKTRNILKIEDEQIHLIDTISINHIEEYMSKYYYNIDKSYLFSETPNSTIISVTYRNMSTQGLKSLLIKIIRAYENLNITLPMKLIFDSPTPPPPPPKKMK